MQAANDALKLIASALELLKQEASIDPIESADSLLEKADAFNKKFNQALSLLEDAMDKLASCAV
jgi:hypothetical protein